MSLIIMNETFWNFTWTDKRSFSLSEISEVANGKLVFEIRISKSIIWIEYQSTAWKVSKYGVCSGPYFPVFGLNTEIYEVNFRIQSEYGKMRTRKNSVFWHFSHWKVFFVLLLETPRQIDIRVKILLSNCNT